MLHKAMQNKGARIAIAVFATFLYALGVNLFIVPVGLYSGGMVGLSQVIRTVLTERVPPRRRSTSESPAARDATVSLPHILAHEKQKVLNEV